MSQHTRIRALSISMGILTIITVLFLYKNKLYSTLYMYFAPKPEVFTQLYFENHIQLPSILEKSTKYTFAFTIHNLEGKDMKYPYVVSIEKPEGKNILDTNSKLIKRNAFKTIKETFSSNLIVSRSEIVVNLVSKNEHIDFWVEPK